MRALTRCIPVIMALGVGACASGGAATKEAPAGAVTPQAAAAKPAKADPDVLTAEQLSKVGGAVSVLRAVQVLRPAWLQARGVDNNDRDYQGMNPSVSAGTKSTGGSILGVLDGEPLNDLSILWNTQVSSVYLVRHYDGAQGLSRYGARGSKGVIYVATSAAKAP